MALWDRVPSVHLIDQIVAVAPRERGWLRFHFESLAATTHRSGGSVQHDARIRWTCELHRPDTMKIVHTRVVLDADGITLLTAYPL